jgi:glucose-6-phosphate isomerase, archaeal
MLRDLTEVSGLPYLFDDSTHHSIFGPEARDPLYGVRTDDEIRKVLLDDDALLPKIVYWMMRDTGLKDGPHRKQTHDLRYDISVFIAAMFGREYLKTSGHYHPAASDGGPAYPEVYGVLSGKAIYLLQKVQDIEAEMEDIVVEDCLIVEGNPGEKVVMPPDYGHVTINPLPEPLVMANWVSNRFQSQYGAVEQGRGFAYYRIEGEGGARWVKNPRYRDVPPLRIARVRQVPELGLRTDLPLFTSGQDEPEAMDWLNTPAEYMDEIWSGLEIIGEQETCELE